MIRIAIVAASAAAGIAILAGGSDPNLPDPTLTPGVIASTDEAQVCGRTGGLTYSQAHRQTTEAMKAQVRQEYHAAHCGEIDHRVPLALGGADDVKNLWCQPGTGAWSYHVKDRLEVYAWEAVCKHHTMTLGQGQAIFLAPDWREEYRKLLGSPKP